MRPLDSGNLGYSLGMALAATGAVMNYSQKSATKKKFPLEGECKMQGREEKDRFLDRHDSPRL